LKVNITFEAVFFVRSMNKLFFLALFVIVGDSFELNAQPVRQVQDIVKDVAFVHVNVITMESEEILMDQTVLIKNSRIASVGPSATITVSNDYFEIDATGKFLMPGLADMHTHIWYEEDLLPYVANGITTVLNLGSPASILEFRDRAAKKELIAPTIYASGFVDGPGSRGWSVRTPAEAEKAVVEIKTNGWDFIKAYNSIPADAYLSLMTKAKSENIAVVGHGVRSMGMQGILNAGQVMIAHAEEYLYTFFGNSPNESKIPEAVALSRNAGVYVIPNLCTYEVITNQWGSPATLDQLLHAPEIEYVSPKWKDSYWKQFNFVSRPGNIDTQYAFLKKLTKGFYDGGVPLLLGSDTPAMNAQANGFAIHDDIRNLISIGLTPYQVLCIGTKNAGDFITKYRPGSVPFGLVKTGYQADLLLLNANPLHDVKALRNRVGVMINGRWLSEDKLINEMQKLRKSFN
jgi:hypothetical protein